MKAAIAEMASINRDANDEYGIQMTMPWEKDREPTREDFEPVFLAELEKAMVDYEEAHGYPVGAAREWAFYSVPVPEEEATDD